jgi:hypothetical protein
MSNPYRLLGMVLCLAGAVLTPLFYFIVGSQPLTAVSISAIMLGFTSLAISNARPYVSPDACQMLLATGTENIAALLEELGLRNRAIYLPSSSQGGSSRAIIPLVEGDISTEVQKKLPGRLIVRYGKNSDSMAIAVTTPGNVCVKMLDTKPGPTAPDIESALTYVLTGMLDIADSVAVSESGSQINVEVRAGRMQDDNIWYYQCIGSPVASIAAAMTSEALGKPVRVAQETSPKGGKRHKIVLEVLD